MTETFNVSIAIARLQNVSTENLAEDAKSDLKFILNFLSNPTWWVTRYKTHAANLLYGDDTAGDLETWSRRAEGHYNRFVEKYLSDGTDDS